MKKSIHLLAILLFVIPCDSNAQEPGVALLDPAFGTWAWDGGKEYFIIEASGAVSETQRKGHWVCKNPTVNPREYIINWDGSTSADFLTLSPDRLQLTGKNKSRAKLEATRVGPVAPINARIDNLMVDGRAFRTWTDGKSDKSFVARLAVWTKDGARLIRKDNGKSAFVISANLIEEDQYFLKCGGRGIYADVEEFGITGWKRVRLKVDAGVSPLLIEVTGPLPPEDRKIENILRPPIKRIVPAGSNLWFDFASTKDYQVKASADGKIIRLIDGEKK